MASTGFFAISSILTAGVLLNILTVSICQCFPTILALYESGKQQITCRDDGRNPSILELGTQRELTNLTGCVQTHQALEYLPPLLARFVAYQAASNRAQQCF